MVELILGASFPFVAIIITASQHLYIPPLIYQHILFPLDMYNVYVIE